MVPSKLREWFVICYESVVYMLFISLMRFSIRDSHIRDSHIICDGDVKGCKCSILLINHLTNVQTF